MKIKNIFWGIPLALFCTFANAGIISFTINQTFSQGGVTDLPSTTISLGGAGSFILDPGFSGDYFDFMFPNSGTFSTTSSEIEGYYFLDSYSLGETLGIGNFGSHISAIGDWDTILVSGLADSIWETSHSGYLGFLTEDSLYGWIDYTFTRTDLTSTITLLNGAYSDVAYADILVGVSEIPEPSSLALFFMGILGFSVWRRRKMNTDI
ncbi:PEP-CTERM sorting domain-containing protein [Vibrio ziniensis]|uniref:PEP-CTERM sorting domain-containing protein n=1 Tax=Vibrio ziniensis TaxID=2711221 RepID=A0A6G7CP66_9VIBR|nr:PEP-CTERM sorting domain-containing protein [Vibrio ziniensis]QIH43880.1 PEP-CTERM sorting domain-containing protein [Vibrio ziniensis]